MIRESSSEGLIMLCVFEQNAACPKSTILLQRFQMAYIIKTKPNDSLVFSNVGCEPLPQALSRAYNIAFQTSREIAGQEPFPILFEGKNGMHALTDSQKFDEFFLSYIRQAYDLTH